MVCSSLSRAGSLGIGRCSPMAHLQPLRYPPPTHRRLFPQLRRHSRFALISFPAFAQFGSKTIRMLGSSTAILNLWLLNTRNLRRNESISFVVAPHFGAESHPQSLAQVF